MVLRLPEYSSGASAQDQHGDSDPLTMATRPSISSGSSGTNSSSASAMISSRSLCLAHLRNGRHPPFDALGQRAFLRGGQRRGVANLGEIDINGLANGTACGVLAALLCGLLLVPGEIGCTGIIGYSRWRGLDDDDRLDVNICEAASLLTKSPAAQLLVMLTDTVTSTRGRRRWRIRSSPHPGLYGSGDGGRRHLSAAGVVCSGGSGCCR